MFSIFLRACSDFPVIARILTRQPKIMHNATSIMEVSFFLLYHAQKFLATMAKTLTRSVGYKITPQKRGTPNLSTIEHVVNRLFKPRIGVLSNAV